MGNTMINRRTFNQMLAISETGAHLQLLAAQGRVTATDDGNIRRYSLP